MPTKPYWFAQRQLKDEEVAPNLLRITGPIFRETFVGIRKGDNGLYQAFVRTEKDGEDAVATEPEIKTKLDAWGAAFELMREAVVV
jgi:hypothetical protein